MDSSSSSSSSCWDILPLHIVELILSLLPFFSIVHATSVCKAWNSVVHSRSFENKVFGSNPLPSLIISNSHLLLSKNIPVAAFIPKFNQWVKIGNLPPVWRKESLIFSNGFFFHISPKIFCFKTILCSTFTQIALPKFQRYNPLIGAYNDPDFPELYRFIIVGGNTFEADYYADVNLGVDIYNPHFDSWERCPQLPKIFKNKMYESSQLLSSVVFNGKFHVFENESCCISSFDLKKHCWSDSWTVRPPWVLFAHLISCQHYLVLAGVVYNRDYNESGFKLWRVDEETQELWEIGEMPEELSSSFFEDKGEPCIKNWKCVGSGNLVYVIGEVYKRNYKACVCEIIGKGECKWIMLPNLPECVFNPRDFRVETFKIASLCYNVCLEDILGKKFSD